MAELIPTDLAPGGLIECGELTASEADELSEEEVIISKTAQPTPACLADGMSSGHLLPLSVLRRMAKDL